jgi:hypothetical protein
MVLPFHCEHGKVGQVRLAGLAHPHREGVSDLQPARPDRIPAQHPRTIQPCVVPRIGQQAEQSVRSSVDKPNYADQASLRVSHATGSSHVVSTPGK